MKELKISMVCTDSTAKFGPIVFREISAEGFRKMKEMGFKGVEFNIRNPAAEDAAAVRDMLGQAGMPVTAVGTGRAFGEDGLSFTNPDADIRKEAVRRIKDHVDFSVKIGKPQIIIGLIRGKIFDEEQIPRATRWMEECLLECAGYAAGSGVRITLEPINRYETALVNTVDQGLELINRLGTGNIGLLLDTFHMNIEEPVMEESIKKASKWIYHFHVADSNRWAPGFGHIDFIPLLRALSQSGYEGYISGELLPLPDPETAARKTLQSMEEVYSIIVNE